MNNEAIALHTALNLYHHEHSLPIHRTKQYGYYVKETKEQLSFHLKKYIKGPFDIGLIEVAIVRIWFCSVFGKTVGAGIRRS